MTFLTKLNVQKIWCKKSEQENEKWHFSSKKWAWFSMFFGLEKWNKNEKMKKWQTLRVYNTLLTLSLEARTFELCPQGIAKRRTHFSEKSAHRLRTFITFFLMHICFSRILRGAGFRFGVGPCEHGSLSVFFRTGRSKKVDFSFDPFAKFRSEHYGKSSPYFFVA